MMSTAARNRYPFTATQWQELEHQALIFKYMVSGMPIPPDLLYTIRRSLDSSLSSQLLLHQPQHVGWNCFQMGFGRKIDPEPGRCRRTDGKKWRCSKEAYPDSKYCERHMHRGRNRSRKPVEITTTVPPPTAIPISSITNKNHLPSSPTSHHSFSCLTSLTTTSESSHHQQQHNNNHFLYTPHHHSSRGAGGAGTDLSSQENNNTTPTTNFLLDSSTFSSSHAGKSGYSSYGQGQGSKEEIDQEHAFFSETSGTMRNNVSGQDSSTTWQMAAAPVLTMGSSTLMNQMKQRSSYLQLDDNYSSRRHKQDQQYYGQEDDQQQTKKVMHHFFDEWPPKDKDSWTINETTTDHQHDKLTRNHHHQAPVSKIQLSISMPNSSHDFFMTRNGT
ncbi:hypothetical protein M9H77_14653 [Catharanthus roseus]|uniref:Uncharacterized protein n=1 Tax=Catharanthus roseus TaxID=4058 RepID=A0ACC0BNX6_CATRO|nr:hypothetical protein M9H77_14653 [Catharanthus roseus]